MAALLTDERKHLVPKSAVMMIDAPHTAVVDMQGDIFSLLLGSVRVGGTAVFMLSGVGTAL